MRLIVINHLTALKIMIRNWQLFFLNVGEERENWNCGLVVRHIVLWCLFGKYEFEFGLRHISILFPLIWLQFPCLSLTFPINYCGIHTQHHNKHNMPAFSFWSFSSGYNRCFSWGMTGVASSHGSVQLIYPEMVTKLIVLNSPHPCVFTGKCPKHLQPDFLFYHALPQRLCFGLGIISMICIIHNEILWFGPGNHGLCPPSVSCAPAWRR